MYLQRIEIENLRSIKHLVWEVEESALAGWHVVIGDNGSGKSTFLRAISMALVGPDNIRAALISADDWLRRYEKRGSIKIKVVPDQTVDSYGVRGNPRSSLSEFGIAFNGEEGSPRISPIDPKTRKKTPTQDDPRNHVWSEKELDGWFSAAYGPFRRFSGGDERREKAYAAYPKLGAHLSVFGEDIALSASVNWLQDLHYRNLDGHPRGKLLQPLIDFINQEGFLPYGVHFEKVTPDEVVFRDANDIPVSVDQLGDGYRSLLSMTFELIRQLERVYGTDKIFAEDPNSIQLPGVVLIDEIDAHLHPTWQRRVGMWFRQRFPKMQFIVTTHSPIICQSVDDPKTQVDEGIGTVFRLPQPGTQAEEGGMVTGIELLRLRYGNVLDAYGTGLFGEGVERSEIAKDYSRRLSQLNIKELRQGLSAAEEKEQQQLRQMLPTG